MSDTDRVAPISTYVVLRRLSHPQDSPGAAHSWTVENESVAATSAEGAIRQHLKGATSAADNTVFVAVPARSWKPVTVKTETQTVLKLS